MSSFQISLVIKMGTVGADVHLSLMGDLLRLMLGACSLGPLSGEGSV